MLLILFLSIVENKIMLDVFIDSLLDSLKVLGIVFVFYIVFSFFESKLAEKLQKNKKLSPFLGSLFGIIPQCGFSVVASDLYIKQHITMGTLIAVFIACSDEALPILLSNPDKILSAIPLIIIKFILGFVVGYIVDIIMVHNKEKVKEHHTHCHHHEEIHVGCCHHEIDNENENKIHQHLIHPLIHSLKIFLYVFIITFLFGILIYLIGEETINQFLINSRYIAPVFTIIIGLIPNCASSVIITNLYLLGGISFGACLSGLIVNAGLGMFFLLKNKENRKNSLIILAILIGVGLLAGYVCEFVSLLIK